MAGKTETIKQRAIYVYLPSEGMAADWKARAKTGGMSISKFVVGNVEENLRQHEEGDFVPAGMLRKEIDALKRQLMDAQEEVRQKKMLVTKLEGDLRSCRLELTKTLDREKDGKVYGDIKLDNRLMRLLMDLKVVSSDEIYDTLGIRRTDKDAVKALKKQLDLLEEKEFIVNEIGGKWKWIRGLEEEDDGE